LDHPITSSIDIDYCKAEHNLICSTLFAQKRQHKKTKRENNKNHYYNDTNRNINRSKTNRPGLNIRDFLLEFFSAEYNSLMVGCESATYSYLAAANDVTESSIIIGAPRRKK